MRYINLRLLSYLLTYLLTVLVPMYLSDLERREARGQIFQMALLHYARTV